MCQTSQASLHHPWAAANPPSMGATQLVQTLEAAGYREIRGLELDDGLWEAEALSPRGFAIELKINPVSGAILNPEVAGGVSAQQVGEQIATINAALPDYARILKFILRPHPFSTADQSLTDNGRLRRPTICLQHAQAIASIYQPQTLKESGEIHAVF